MALKTSDDMRSHSTANVSPSENFRGLFDAIQNLTEDIIRIFFMTL